MRILLIFVISILSLVLLSCEDNENIQRLKIIESLMNERPDSAYRQLLLMDAKTLSGKKEKALYALLMSQALDKNYIDVTDDSLIIKAIEYYGGSKDSYHYMLSLYYQGRVYQNGNCHTAALMSFMEALQVGKKINNPFWLGMISKGISQIYNKLNNSMDELTFAQKEVLNFRKSGKQPYLNYALSDLACSYLNARQCDKSIRLSNQMIDSALIHKDNILIRKILRIKAKALMYDSKFKDALGTWNQFIRNGGMTHNDSVLMAICKIKIGKYEEWMDKMITSTNISASHCWLGYVLAEKDNDKERVLNYMIQLDSINNLYLKRMSGQNQNSIMAEYLNLKIEALGKEAAYRTFWLVTIMIVIVLLAIIIFLVGLIYIGRKRSRFDKILTIARSLTNDLSFDLKRKEQALLSLKGENNLMQSRIDELGTKFQDVDKENIAVKNENERLTRKIISLLPVKYELVDELFNQLYTYGDNLKSRDKIYETVTKLSNGIKFKGNKISELEKFVNTNVGNIIDLLKQDIPTLSDMERHFFIYSILGFSNDTTAFFLGKAKTSDIYNLRRHLKDKIKKLEENKQIIYLRFL